MTFKDGAGNVTFSGLRWDATAVVAAVAVAPLSPADGTRTPSVGVPLQFAVDNNGGTNTDVQVQVATDAAFATVVSAPSPTNLPNGVQSVQPTGLVADTTYYWRARGAPTGTTSWGAWSTTRTFTVDVDTGRAFGYSYENVGARPVLYAGALEYVTANIGLAALLYSGWIDYSYENIGFAVTIKSAAADYAYESGVSTNTPAPHIWWLVPSAGRPSDGVAVVGLGFGDLPATYGGVVEMFRDGAWTPVGVVAWQTFPAAAEAYGPDRRIDENAGQMDPQHQIIEISIPLDAEPPGYPLRVRTEGP